MKKDIQTAALITIFMAAFNTFAGINVPLLSFNKRVMESSNSGPVIPVTVTAYSPTIEECDDDPFITAYQRPVKVGTIAISRDLENEFGWQAGDLVHVIGLGVFEVNDRMHHKWKKRVDIFFSDTEKAVSFGIKRSRAIKIKKPATSWS